MVRVDGALVRSRSEAARTALHPSPLTRMPACGHLLPSESFESESFDSDARGPPVVKARLFPDGVVRPFPGAGPSRAASAVRRGRSECRPVKLRHSLLFFRPLGVSADCLDLPQPLRPAWPPGR